MKLVPLVVKLNAFVYLAYIMSLKKAHPEVSLVTLPQSSSQW